MDVSNARICEDFVEDVRERLTPEKFALVAEISEDSTTPVDTRMEALGGTVYRRALKEVKRTFHDDNAAAMKADRAQLTAERAKAHAERKVKLQQKIDELDSKIAARHERARQRREAAEAQEKAKAEFLQARAAVMKANAPQKHVSPPE
jgi:putative cell wall-binding protein